MPNVVQTNLSAGKVGERMWGRIDNPKFLNGLAEFKNTVPFIQGGATRRPGTIRISDSTADFNTNDEHQLVGVNIGDKGAEEYYFLEFSENSLRIFRSDESAITASGTFNVSATEKADIIQNIVTTYADADIPDLYVVGIGTDQIYITHKNHEPAILTVGDPPSGGGWALADIDFTCHPFVDNDDSDTVLRISNESEIIALESDTNEGWSTLPNLATNVRYVEYRVRNEWFLGRILDSNTTPSAPDPTDTKIYVDPVEGVVAGVDPAAKFVHVDSSDDDADTHEFRSDTLVFDADMEGAWIRIVSEYDQMRDPGFADGEVYWGKISKYDGERDFPTKFLTDPTEADFDVGSIYKITENRGTTPERYEVSAPVTGTSPTTPDWDSSFNYSAVGDQFSWQNHARIETNGSGTGEDRLDNLSSLKTFDVVELNDTTAEPVLSTDATYITGGSVNLIQATGNLTILDANTDPGGSAGHTATLNASRASTFVSGDVGKFIQLQLGTEWVTFEITSYTDAKTVDVDVINSIPRETNGTEFLNEGQSAIWRKSVWGANDWPHTITFYEQRLIFGGSPSHPHFFWASKIEDNFDLRTVEDDGSVLDTTGIAYPLSSTDLAQIKWMLPGPTLVIGTTQKEWQVKPNSFGQALTQENIRITSETEIGSEMPAIRAGSSIFFVERGGRGFRELYFDFSIDGFRTRDLLTVEPGILEGETIQDFAYQKFPNSVFWVVTSGGRLLSFTYDPENNFYAWAEHGLTGLVSIASAPRTSANFAEDAIWMAVNFGGAVVGQGEILALTPTFKNPTTDGYNGKMYFMDKGLHVSEDLGDTVTSVTGLSGMTWFSGETVGLVVDGVYKGEITFDGLGAASFPTDVVAERNFSVGTQLFNAVDLLTLPHASQGPAGPNWGKIKRFRHVWAFVVESLHMKVADENGTAREISFHDPANHIHGKTPPLYTGFKGLDYEYDSEVDPRVRISTDKPYPLTILALGYDLDTND